MKTYRSIPGPSKAPKGEHCIAFYKHDGSNIRVEYNRKQGWYKFGTRRQMIDDQDPCFGPAIDVFKNTQAEGLAKVFTDNPNYRNADSIVVFLEYFGPSSFGCYHDYTEKFRLSLIDVDIPKRGFVLPSQFVKDFGHLDHAHVVYRGPFDDQFVQDVKDNKFGLKEGVVAKGVSPCKGLPVHGLWMCKVKTKWWMTELKRRAKESVEFKQLLTDNEREQQ